MNDAQTQLTTSIPPDSVVEAPSKASEPEPIKVEVEVDILKAIHAELSGQLKFTSERSFTSSIQTITLNLVVLGGLIINKLSLSPQARLLGSVMLGVFNMAILSYIISKGAGYAKVKKELLTIRGALASKCPSIDLNTIQTTPSRTSFVKGTGMMFLAVAISCICTICGFWLPLTENTSKRETASASTQKGRQPTANTKADTTATPLSVGKAERELKP